MSHTSFLKKSVNTSLVAKSSRLESAPLVIIGYFHLIHMNNFKTNSLSINRK